MYIGIHTKWKYISTAVLMADILLFHFDTNPLILIKKNNQYAYSIHIKAHGCILHIKFNLKWHIISVKHIRDGGWPLMTNYIQCDQN